MNNSENRVQTKREAQIKASLEMARAAMHELAQPLTVLIGRCELIDMLDEKNPKIKKHIDSILSNAKKVGDIVCKIQEINKQMTKQYIETDRVAENLEKSLDSSIYETPALSVE